MRIHPRLVGGLVSLLVIFILILIDKIFHTEICSNKMVILIICIIGGIITYIITKKENK